MKVDRNPEWDEQLIKTRRALGENLLAARHVLGTESDDEVRSITEVALEERSNVSRSAIRTISNGESSNGRPPNPDLKTICHLAAALNIPPAFLLMSGDDWRRLLNAIKEIQNTVQKESVIKAEILQSLKSDKATAGLKLMMRLGTYPDRLNVKVDDDVDEAVLRKRLGDIDRRNGMKRLSILVTTAIAQNYSASVSGNGSKQTKETDLAMLTTLAALFGADIQTN